MNRIKKEFYKTMFTNYFDYCNMKMPTEEDLAYSHDLKHNQMKTLVSLLLKYSIF